MSRSDEDPTPVPDEGLGPAEESELTRLLAEAGGPVPMPAEVSARLEAVLADLVRERASVVAGASVTSLAAQRRRWPRLLLAAAAVVAGGYAVGQATLLGGQSGQDAESAVVAEGDVGNLDRSDEEAAPGAPDEPAEGPAAGTARRDQALVLLPVPRLRADALEPGVRRVLGELEPADSAPRATSGACRPPAVGAGAAWLDVRYDGRRATLTLRPAYGEAGEPVRAVVRDCSGGVLAAVTLPRP